MLAGLIVAKGEKRKLVAALREAMRSLDGAELAAKTGLWVQNVYPALRQLEREGLVESFAGRAVGEGVRLPGAVVLPAHQERPLRCLT